jgi:hypothetical protein
VIGQTGQVMPGTVRVTVFDAAHAETDNMVRHSAIMEIFGLLKANSFP